MQDWNVLSKMIFDFSKEEKFIWCIYEAGGVVGATLGGGYRL